MTPLDPDPRYVPGDDYDIPRSNAAAIIIGAALVGVVLLAALVWWWLS